jgi:hypothetical protein
VRAECWQLWATSTKTALVRVMGGAYEQRPVRHCLYATTVARLEAVDRDEVRLRAYAGASA